MFGKIEVTTNFSALHYKYSNFGIELSHCHNASLNTADQQGNENSKKLF